MKHAAFLTLCVSAFVCSCNSPQNSPPAFGAIDSLAIARDTATQLGIEASYEYNKTLSLNAHEVFDLIGYGGPSKGEIAIVYRNASGRKDTVGKEARTGIVKQSWLTDLNHNGRPEILMVIQTYDTLKYEHLLGFETNREKQAVPLRFNIALLKQYVHEYRGNDTMYYQADKEVIYHEFPLIDSNRVAGRMKIEYGLTGDRFIAKNFSIENY